jgi:hypothetical protein
MKKWKITAPLVVFVLAAGWYAFRPERMIVNQRVDEAMLTAQTAPSVFPLWDTPRHPCSGFLDMCTPIRI